MKIKISNSFLIILALMIATNGLKLFSFILFSCFLHELGHIIAIKAFGCNIQTIEVSFFCAKIKSYDINNLSNIKCIIIYSQGIIVNIILAVVSNHIALQGFYSYNFFLLSGINYLLAILNSLPISILDGGNILRYTLNIITSKKNASFFSYAISILCNILFLIFSIFFVKTFNLSLLVISFTLFFSTIKHNI